MSVKNIVIFGYGARGYIYASFALSYPDKFKVVAIIENNPERLGAARSLFPDTPLFNDYHDFLKQNIKADIVAVATQDDAHLEHAVAMMEAGYDLLLEKPISNKEEDCLKIYEVSKKTNRKVIVCHVLRYTPFYSKIKEIIDEGKLGDIITINASENVGYYHQAHSFVRGPWRNSKESSPMILAKCCHDMDIIRYLIGEKCLSINSYGTLSFFKKENAPKDSEFYCSKCPHKDCIYNAQKIYTSEFGRGFSSYFTTKEKTDENILKDLEGSQYDRCVFKCDNDVVDHQVTIMQFDKSITACHTMTAFSKDIYRDIKIHGTKAELVGSIESNHIEIRYFSGAREEINIDLSNANIGGHMGGDFYMMNELYNVLNGNKGQGITYLDVSIDSHLMAFAAEKSRLNNGETIKVGK